ncbi:MAG TPA: COX15/CtaA family protein [Opitutaceae bacterium]|nr:COX15/CtaA family protein [Opitutaceae bacterium]
MTRTAAYKPALAWFAALGSGWVFVIVTLGAFTTSIGAGMVFADWPLSNGSINPEGWLQDVAMFAEHSHRLTGAVMGLLTIGLVAWLHVAEERAWLRRLGWWALGIVVVQGLIGGQRVKLDAVDVPGFDMSLGQILRIPHGILAQVFVCVLFAIAAGLSRSWIAGGAAGASTRVKRLGAWCVALLFVQLTVAATMRHNGAGLAIPTFPLSTPDGGLLPADWDFRVGIHFLHRVMAAALAVALAAYGHFLWRDRAVGGGLRAVLAAVLVLLVAQIALGGYAVWSGRNPYVTTAHVIVGCLMLACTFLLAFFTRRGAFDGPAPTRA